MAATMVTVAALAWWAVAPASAMDNKAGGESSEQIPRQTFLGGAGALGAELESMERAGEAVVRALARAPGTPEARYRRGELELHMAMRPEFGPANAALFGRRERLLDALARAVKLDAARRPPDRGHALDRFAEAVLSARRALEAKGFAVESAPAAGPMPWTPPEPAWSLVARDESRKVAEYAPYAGSPAGQAAPAEPRRVHPRQTFLFAAPQRLRCSSSLVRREQPAEPVGALNGALVFTPDPAQSLDQDDAGRLRAEALGALFPGGARAEVPLAGGGKAVLENGLLRVSGGEAPTPEATRRAAPGARALLWTATDGPDIRRLLVPLE